MVSVRRLIAVFLVTALMAGGAWLLTREEEKPPPMGLVSPAEAVPENVEGFTLNPQPGCHPDVPGWWGFGETAMSGTELETWYTERFGPLNQAITDRLQTTSIQPDGPGFILEYEDLRVSYGPGGSGEESLLSFHLLTYETVGHRCPLRSADLWDIDPVTTYLVREGCLSFRGVEYQHQGVGTPPSDWERRAYDNGRAIAFNDSKPRLLFEQTNSDVFWQRYEGRCYQRD